MQGRYYKQFVSEIHQIWKDLLLLDSPNVHSPLKKFKELKKANFNCKWRISLLIEHALIIWDKIETLQVQQQARKHQMREVNTTVQHKKNKQEKINKFELLFILVVMTGSLILVPLSRS